MSSWLLVSIGGWIAARWLRSDLPRPVPLSEGSNEFYTSRWIVTKCRLSEATGNVRGEVHFHTAGFPMPRNELRFSPLAGSCFVHSCTGWNRRFSWALTASSRAVRASRENKTPLWHQETKKMRDKTTGDVLEKQTTMQLSYRCWSWLFSYILGQHEQPKCSKGTVRCVLSIYGYI